MGAVGRGDEFDAARRLADVGDPEVFVDHGQRGGRVTRFANGFLVLPVRRGGNIDRIVTALKSNPEVVVGCGQSRGSFASESGGLRRGRPVDTVLRRNELDVASGLANVRYLELVLEDGHCGGEFTVLTDGFVGPPIRKASRVDCRFVFAAESSPEVTLQYGQSGRGFAGLGDVGDAPVDSIGRV